MDILDIIFWLFLIMALALLIWKAFWGSPNDFYILFTLSMGILFKILSISSKLERHLGEDKQFKRSFMTLAKDFKEHAKKK